MADSRHAQDLQWQSLWECERAEPGINGLHQSKVFVTLCVTRHDVTRAHGEESGARDWLGARDGRDQAGQADQTRDLMRGNWTKWIKHWLTDGGLAALLQPQPSPIRFQLVREEFKFQRSF